MAYHQVSASSLTPSRPAPQAPRLPVYNSNTLAASGYNPSFSLTSSSPSGSSYAPSYSGIGGSPNRMNESFGDSRIVRNGVVSVKEDGFASWLWRPKWLILKEQTLSIHKNEVCFIVHVFGGRLSVLDDLDLISFPFIYPPLSIDCTPTKHHLPARYIQHRTHRPETLLLTS
jgi:hypothetical protein